MKDLFKIIAAYDAEGREIVSNARDEADRMIKKAKAESQEKISIAQNKFEDFEQELKKQYNEKFLALKQAHDAELEQQITHLKSIVKKNKERAVSQALELIETLK
nr:hypothetical protein [Candidatus Sigynarchaeota archaeon]